MAEDAGRHPGGRVLLVVIISALSGALWGALAWSLLDRPSSGRTGALAASPLIGIAAGLVAARYPRLNWWQRALWALGGLYAAAGLFGVAFGLSTVMSGPEGSHWSRPGVGESVAVILWGLTVTGWCLWLWPLAYLNYHLIWQLRGRDQAL